VTYLVNSSQSVVASYKYDPYGRLISSSGSLASANVCRFSSKEWVYDGGAGYYYYGYRFYDPLSQRWLNRDPLWEPGFQTFAGTHFVSLDVAVNLLAYVANDPIGRFDPLGLTDRDNPTERCKDRCLKWGEQVTRSGGNGPKAAADCDNACDRDPTYVPGTPIPPLPAMKPKLPTTRWAAIKEVAKTAKECWKQLRKRRD